MHISNELETSRGILHSNLREWSLENKKKVSTILSSKKKSATKYPVNYEFHRTKTLRNTWLVLTNWPPICIVSIPMNFQSRQCKKAKRAAFVGRVLVNIKKIQIPKRRKREAQGTIEKFPWALEMAFPSLNLLVTSYFWHWRTSSKSTKKCGSGAIKWHNRGGLPLACSTTTSTNYQPLEQYTVKCLSWTGLWPRQYAARFHVKLSQALFRMGRKPWNYHLSQLLSRCTYAFGRHKILVSFTIRRVKETGERGEIDTICVVHIHMPISIDFYSTRTPLFPHPMIWIPFSLQLLR